MQGERICKMVDSCTIETNARVVQIYELPVVEHGMTSVSPGLHHAPLYKPSHSSLFTHTIVLRAGRRWVSTAIHAGRACRGEGSDRSHAV